MNIEQEEKKIEHMEYENCAEKKNKLNIIIPVIFLLYTLQN